MIRLITNKYCDNCPDFDAETDILYGDEGVVAINVECSNRDKCDRIYRYLKKELQKNDDTED